MTEITFVQKGNVWVGETDSLGRAVLQITRKSRGNLEISRYLPDMAPALLESKADASDNEIMEINVPKGLKLHIESATPVVKCKIIAANFIMAPEGTLMEDDLVNDLTTGGADKPLAAEQGKALKALIPTDVLKTTDLVNDLTSGGTNKALTAEQGKQLKASIPVAATTAKSGTVKKMAKIDNLSTESATDLKNKINDILAKLKTAEIMEA